MSLDFPYFKTKMTPAETTIITAIIVGRVMTTSNEEQYVWFAFLIFLCGIVCVENTDIQITAAASAVAVVFVPFSTPVIVVLRLCSHAYKFAKQQKHTSDLPFESMYPDSIHTGDPLPPTNHQRMCF